MRKQKALKLFTQWKVLEKRHNDIDHDAIDDSNFPEFGNDPGVSLAWQDFQLDRMREYEDDLEFDMQDIEETLLKNEFKIINVFNEKQRKFYWKLVTFTQYKALIIKMLMKETFRKEQLSSLDIVELMRLAQKHNIYI